MIQEFFSGKEPNRSIYPDEAVEYVLQCRAQSSQVKVLTIAGLAVIGCDSFAYGLECSWLMMLEGTVMHMYGGYPIKYHLGFVANVFYT